MITDSSHACADETAQGHGRSAAPRSFQSPQEVKWCPGCGDYSILSQVLKVLPELGVPRENVVFVSGIGCSSRFPYYLNTYGIHGIHGRAPALATGLKSARPELSVWVITGDGDGLSIGLNHLVHCIRRNLDVNILLFNNQIYGLTKGQYSPTSEFGKRTKTSPQGTIEPPLRPVKMALAAAGTFVARSVFSDPSHLGRMIEAAARHKGTSLVEILQNCLVFNDGAFTSLVDRATRDEHRILLEHGKPIRFGAGGTKGIVLRRMQPVVAVVGQDGVREEDLLVHDACSPNSLVAELLASLEPPDFPTPLGILRQVERPTYEDLLTSQVREARGKSGRHDLARLLDSGTAWTVD